MYLSLTPKKKMGKEIVEENTPFGDYFFNLGTSSDNRLVR